MQKEITETIEAAILYAYENETAELLKEFSSFTLYFEKKEYKAKRGEYIPASNSIYIFNFTRNQQCLWITILHEVAHHIDCKKRGTSDHGKHFYHHFEKLLWTGLDMRILNKEEIALSTDYSCDKKICAIVDAWIPNYKSFSLSRKIISLKNAYVFRNELKSVGYVFNNDYKTWELICGENDFDNELEAIKDLFSDKDIAVKNIFNTDIRVACFIRVSGFTYAYKEILKSLKYQFDKKNKYWYKFINAPTYSKEKKELLDRCATIKEEQITIHY